jgi:hypothetical protein
MTRTTSANCVHHWVLSLPEDDIVKGKCKRCGAKREYPASVEGASRMGIYDEAASLSRSVSLLPDGGRNGLPGVDRKW